MNIVEQIQQALHIFLQETYHLTLSDTRGIETTMNADEKRQQFGDLSSNAALILSTHVGTQPRAIAKEITLTFSHPAVERIDIAGPGFLNIYLTHHAYTTLLEEMTIQKEVFFKPTNVTSVNYNVEFVSANPTGPLHFGHGRGGIIGDVLAKVLSFVGCPTQKEFYVNDAGSQIQKLGQSFKIRCLQALGEDLQLPEDGYQGTYLIELARTCVTQHGAELKKQSDQFFADYAKSYMLTQLQTTLDTYGITFDTWFSEKTLHDTGKIDLAVTRLTDAEYTYEEDGALWFKSTLFNDDKDRVLRKKDGTWTYVAADIAYMLDKVQRGAQHLIMVLGQDHHGYVERLHGIHKALGLNHTSLNIILYQLVSIKEGGQELRMSKRAGRMVTLKDIIDAVGKDVARFFYLNRKADAQLEFDLDLALKKTDENPVYYIQYAFVRILSILKRATEHADLGNINEKDACHITNHEHLILKKIASLKSILYTIASTYQTHLLTYYALELAQLFHSYYSKNKVVDTQDIPTSRARLLTLKQLQMTFACLLDLMGLEKPESM
jgi:arginyl-tRNA synthetase